MSEERIGKYQVEKAIGEGGMGKVYRALDADLDRTVAIKLMLTGLDLKDDLRQRFFREARAAAKLQHPNIVAIYELSEDQGRPFIAMEFVEGHDLSEIIRKHEYVPFAKKLGWMIQTCRGLHYAHVRKIVHRDIKPGNIRISTEGIAKILDFGLARFAASELTMSNTMMGTPHYMSPEQIRGVKDLDGRSDLWAVGVMLYLLVSGRRPFDADNPHALAYQIVNEPAEPLDLVMPGCSEQLSRIVDRCLAKDARERFATCEDLEGALDALRPHLDDERHVLAARIPPLEQALGAVRAEWLGSSDLSADAAGLFAPPVLDGDASDYGTLLHRHAWLARSAGLVSERIQPLRDKLARLEARSRVMEERGEWSSFQRTQFEILQLHPGDASARRRLEVHRDRLPAEPPEDEIDATIAGDLPDAGEAPVRREPTPAPVPAYRDPDRTHATPSSGSRGLRPTTPPPTSDPPERPRSTPPASRPSVDQPRAEDADLTRATPPAATRPRPAEPRSPLPPAARPALGREPSGPSRPARTPLPRTSASVDEEVPSAPVLTRLLRETGDGSPGPPPPAGRRWGVIAAAAAAVIGVTVAAYLLTRTPGPAPTPEDKTPPPPSVAANAPGSLVLDILPWATVDVTRLPGGERVEGPADPTPCVLTLPAGQYRLVARNPSLNASTELEVTISPGQVTRASRVLPGFDSQKEALTLLRR